MLSEFYKREQIPLTPAFGAKYPEYFIHPAAEYHALVRFCGVIDLTHWRVLRVRGGDRAGFLNALLTNDVVSLQPGHGCHSMMTTVKGKIISELFVFARKSDHLVAVSQGDFGETLAVLRSQIVREDVAFDDVSADCAILGVEGPEAKTVLHRLLGTGPLPTSVLAVLEREFEDFTVSVVQNSATGEPGFHVVVPAGEVLRIRNYLVQAARGSDGLPVGRAAWDIRRVEKGLPWYGVDFTGDEFPQESRLGDAVSYTKGRFRGQETLARLHDQGHVDRLLVGLVPEDEGSPGDGVAHRLNSTELPARAARDAELLDLRSLFAARSRLYDLGHGGEGNDPAGPRPVVGRITSAVYSFALSKPLLMGYVRREWLERDRSFFVDTPHGVTKLRVIELPVALD